MSLESFIKLIKDGEPVSAGTANRPIQQLDQNVQYLWNVLQAASVGSTVYARGMTVLSTLAVGQPVYFNSTTNQFEPAYAVAQSDSATGYLIVPDQAQVWGIVAQKLNATLADILLFGYAKIDISAAVGTEINLDGSVPAGTWYLSSAGAGALTKQLPPITIPVCKTDNAGGVYVNPRFVDFLENHRHYVFDLEMFPAGDVTPPLPGGTHVITNANSSLPGWLPVSDPVFNGLAPTGAKFGYNLSQDETLSGVYPPVPIQSACAVMQRPSVYDTTGEHRWYGQQLMPDLLVIDRNGLWWMSDCYDEVPWPTTLDTTSSVSESYGECDPAGKSYSLKLYYARVGFATDNTSVSSLQSLDPRLIVHCAGQPDNPATTGDLQINLNLAFMIGQQNLGGYTVIKSFDPLQNKFDFGKVCEGVYATSPNVLLSGASQTIGGETVYQGPVGIGVLTSATQELSSQLVQLNGVTEENYPVLYLGMPDDVATSYVVKFEVPADAPVSSDFQLRLRILGRAAGTLPQLTAAYYLANRPPNGLSTPVAVTQSYTALTVTTVATVGANEAVEALSAAFAVAPGDIVYIQVQRTPAAISDAYAGELGIMQQVGVLTATT